MRRSRKFIPWLLPVLGFVLGYAYAYASFHGLLETWHFIGSPEAKIERILGINEASKILIATEIGQIYSLEFSGISFNGYYYEGEFTLPRQFAWVNEKQDIVDPAHPIRYYGADFFAWPPLFKVLQQYKVGYIYQIEGKGEVNLALADDGNLWIWKHQIAGLTGVILYFYPAMGIFTGLIIALIVSGVNWFKNKNRSK